MEYIFLVFVAIIVLIFVIYFANRRKREKLKMLCSELEENGTTISQGASSPDGKHYLFIDECGEQWGIIDVGSSESSIYEYSDLVNYELFEDGIRLLNNADDDKEIIAALFGSLSDTEVIFEKHVDVKKCSDLVLRLETMDISNPLRELFLLNGTVKKDSLRYKDSKNAAVRFCSILALVLKKAQKVKPIENGTESI